MDAILEWTAKPLPLLAAGVAEDDVISALSGVNMVQELEFYHVNELHVIYVGIMNDAARQGFDKVIKYMLDVNPKMPLTWYHDATDRLPLGHAAMNGHLTTVRMLVEEYDADVNEHQQLDFSIDEEFRWFSTPLDSALPDEKFVARYLLRAGAWRSSWLRNYWEEDPVALQSYADNTLRLMEKRIQEEVLERWAQVRRLARHVGRIALFTLRLFAEVLAPGGAAYKRVCREWHKRLE